MTDSPVPHPARSSLLSRLWQLAENPWLRALVPVGLAAAAVLALHLMSRQVNLADVKADLAAAPLSALALAVLATLASYAALSMYDVLAVRKLAPDRVPLRVAALAGASGYAISNLLGTSYLTGTAVRYRVYGTVGIELGLVLGIIATSWSAFWMAALLILGLLMVLHPTGLAAVLPVSPTLELAVGLGLLIALAGFLVWLSRRPRSVTLGGHSYPLPDLRLALGLLVVAVLDIGGAALTLYALLPADAAPNLAVFFTVYVAAITLGILSHTPGGIGVFEAAIIAGLGAAGRSDVLAALLLYRLVYTVLPFVVAALGMAVLWTLDKRDRLGRARDLLAPIVPILAAGIALVSGVILLLSGNLPSDPTRVSLLRGVFPLAFVEVSHLLGSVAGILLLIVARGLHRRLARAWTVAMLLLGVGLAASLSKGLDWKEALSLATALGILGMFRSAFYRMRQTSVFRLNGPWLAGLVALVLPIFWLGFFAYGHVAYRNDLWWNFAWDGDASRFLRATLIVAVVMLAVGFNALVLPRGPRQRPGAIPDAVLDLVARSPDPEAQISLSGDKSFLVDPTGRAFLAYADTGRTLVSKGDPVGDPEAARQLIWTFREMADQAGRRCAFYSVGSAFLPTYLDLGLSILKIGEVARVDLTRFTLEGSAKRDFRQAVNKSGREGYAFELLPKAQVSAAFSSLKSVSDAWLASRSGAEKGFSLGSCSADYLAHFDQAVLRHVESDRIVAFANLMQGADRSELSLDLMRHDPHGPKFAMDALFGHIMLWGRDQGFHWFSLGAAPLSGLENHHLASLWNRFGGFVRDHGERFYHFEGLRSFKEKFDPVWTPEYLACPRGLAVPQVLYEVSTLISKGVRGLVR